MIDALIISPSNCRGWAWLAPSDISFAQSMPLVPVHSGELAKAAANSPLAFTRRNDYWELVAVCGLSPDYNLFVRDGKWMGLHQPGWLSTFPFFTQASNNRQVLAFDRSSNMLVQPDEGEPFFDAEGNPSASVAAHLEQVKRQQQYIQSAHSAVQKLADAEVIAPWPEALKAHTGIHLDDLYTLDERALSNLDGARFASLRQALPLAYATNFSIQQCHVLHRLARLHPKAATDSDFDMEAFFDDADDTLRFDF